MYVSESTVNKVYRIFKKWGCIKDPFVGKVGRRKIFSRQDMLVRIFLMNVINIIY